MGKYLKFLLLLQLLASLEAKTKLEISKIVNGTETPVSESIDEIAGTNVILICNIKPRTPGNFNKLITWGKKKDESYFQFNNLTDLINMADTFFNQSKTAAKAFSPLLETDTGTYFCMNSQMDLFKTVYINVTAAPYQEVPNVTTIMDYGESPVIVIEKKYPHNTITLMFATVSLIMSTWAALILYFKLRGMYKATQHGECDVHTIPDINQPSVRVHFAGSQLHGNQVVLKTGVHGTRHTPSMA